MDPRFREVGKRSLMGHYVWWLSSEHFPSEPLTCSHLTLFHHLIWLRISQRDGQKQFPGRFYRPLSLSSGKCWPCHSLKDGIDEFVTHEIDLIIWLQRFLLFSDTQLLFQEKHHSVPSLEIFLLKENKQKAQPRSEASITLWIIPAPRGPYYSGKYAFKDCS